MAALSHSNTSSGSDVDPLDLLDLSEYDGMSHMSPSLSPSVTSSKMQFARPATSVTTTPSTLPSNQILSGPSHQYDQYKQQTPFVPGALANTLALNESNVGMSSYNVGFIHPGEELYNFSLTPSQESMATPTMDLDFDSPADAFFFPTTSTTNVTPITTQPGVVGRMYPGMHQRMAKAQAQHMQQQQQQQQQGMMQRQNQQQQRPQQSKQSRSKVLLPPDPLVEQKISQVLNSMRSQVGKLEPEDDSPVLHISRPKKEEGEMDDDERLLASEAGKKLTSKERRQLRNKVSARAFRSRRKEYIGQLESEIATKVTENNLLRTQNEVLMSENKRLVDLTKMLLASPSFSSFLDALSSDPAAMTPAQPQIEQRQPERTQVPKDPNPYNTMNSGQQQQIGMVMIPEQSLDFSMLNMNPDPFTYQPRVFAVLETPELPEINTDALIGKSSNFVGEAPVSDSDKADAPSLETRVSSSIEKPQSHDVSTEPLPSEKVAADLDGDIFDDDDHSVPSPCPLELDTDGFSAVDIFGGIEPEKAFSRYELVDSTQEEKVACMALRRVERLAASLAVTFSALERLDTDL